MMSSTAKVADPPRADSNSEIEAAFDCLSGGLYRYVIVRAGGDVHLADDVMQHVWLAGLQKGRSVPLAEMEFWLRRVSALHLLGPTGGYLVGFVLGAFVTGVLSERGWDRRLVMTALAMTLGTIALFVPGLIWLAFIVGPHNVLTAGFWPFLPGAVIKIALATALLPQGWKVLHWLGGREFAAARQRR